MELILNKKSATWVFLIVITVGLIAINGCVESKKVAAKSGAQLWAENCSRCHNAPAPTTFSQEQWKTVGMHMQSRALLTNNERDKIVDFLQQSN
jgi:cytochrome c553